MALTNSRTTFIVVILSVFWIQTAYSNAVAEDEGVPMTRLRTGARDRRRRATSSSNVDRPDRKLQQAEAYDFFETIPNEDTMSMINAQTQKPSQKPTNAPTERPTGGPTPFPTRKPSTGPTVSPTLQPTNRPTIPPTQVPTSSPSGRPTTAPSSSPSIFPSAHPSGVPSGAPSGAPSAAPSSTPSARPSRSPTGAPTRSPSNRPTTSEPTILPSAAPSSSAAPTAKRKKEKKRVGELYYLSEEEATELWSLPAQSGGDEQQLPYEFNEAFGIDDTEYAKTETAASEGRMFGNAGIALRLPLFEGNDAIVDQEEFGTVDPRLPLLPIDP